MREESSLAAPKQHYAGHPEPTNGSASIAADINGEHRIKISEKSPHMRGLQGRPDTQDGLAHRQGGQLALEQLLLHPLHPYSLHLALLELLF